MTNKEIRELMRFFDTSDITKVKIKNGDFSIELQKGFEGTPMVAAAPMAHVAPMQAPIAAPVAQATETTPAPKTVSGDTINSPMVGTFYKAPAPGAAAFVQVGSTVKKGQTIGIIEAMKIMNEIDAEFDCKIVEILVEDGQPIEYDMPLFAVEKL